MNKKTLARYMISKQGKVWNTEPERNFQLYQLSRGMGLVQNRSFHVVQNGTPYDYQLDFAHATEEGWDYEVEVDGVNHDSEINHRKDLWKDFVKAKNGLKVIHVPAVLTEKKWWPYLDSEFAKALTSKSRSIWIVA